jgi:hypothetical protein
MVLSTRASILNFSFGLNEDVRNQFLNQLRSATTKGAHKRQLELLFPTTLSISVDIHAPKLWLPVSSTISDGALYIDAGRLKVGLIKPAKVSNTRYGLELNDIEIKFLHEDPSCGGSSDKPKVNTIDLTAVHRLHNEIVVSTCCVHSTNDLPQIVWLTIIFNDSDNISIQHWRHWDFHRKC